MHRDAVVPVIYDQQQYPQQMIRQNGYGEQHPAPPGYYYPQATPTHVTAINANGEVHPVQPLVLGGPSGSSNGSPYYFTGEWFLKTL